ncbi:hypothetical protein ACFWBB_27110 [Streptomyces sp. NPDC060000]|uniref:hypothetical protein n=1 Tax=Streptomyces sp. NPDC060000 TaxID=3347031 RepID=UPI0036BD55B3
MPVDAGFRKAARRHRSGTTGSGLPTQSGPPALTEVMTAVSAAVTVALPGAVTRQSTSPWAVYVMFRSAE